VLYFELLVEEEVRGTAYLCRPMWRTATSLPDRGTELVTVLILTGIEFCNMCVCVCVCVCVFCLMSICLFLYFLTRLYLFIYPYFTTMTWYILCSTSHLPVCVLFKPLTSYHVMLQLTEYQHHISRWDGSG